MALLSFCRFFFFFLLKLKTFYNIELKFTEHLTDHLLHIASPGHELKAIATEVIEERLTEGGEGKRSSKRLTRYILESS